MLTNGRVLGCIAIIRRHTCFCTGPSLGQREDALA
jgi:hypothetical protein